MRRVSYHQSVFDLLNIQPQESPQALEMIESCEARTGRRLPEAVRQWYLLKGVVALRLDGDWNVQAGNQRETLWYDFSNMDWPESLETVLQQFGRELASGPPWWGVDRLWVLAENQGCCQWFILLDGTDDPPVFEDPSYDHRQDAPESIPPPEKVANRFSAFVFDWFVRFYCREWTPLSQRDYDPHRRTRPPQEKPYLDGLWLYAPDTEPLAPPYLDFLSENFSEDSRQEITSGVMQYRFHTDRARLRVTTDNYGEESGVSAWWLHADSEEDLFRLARQAWWFGDLPTSLRAWTKPAQSVIDRLHESDRHCVERHPPAGGEGATILTAGKRQVRYWAIGGDTEATGRYIRQTSCPAHFAIVTLRLEIDFGPDAVVFVNRLDESSAVWLGALQDPAGARGDLGTDWTPYISEVVEGVKEALAALSSDGNPIQALKISLTGMKVHPIDSYGGDFRQAAILAVKEAIQKVGLVEGPS